MAHERFAVLGVAHVRSAWFHDLARAATSGALPIEFTKCVSVPELRARLTSGRAWSAVVADGGLAGVDRDLADLARNAGCALLVVDDGRTPRDWLALGATAKLTAPFGRDELFQLLKAHGRPVQRNDALTGIRAAADDNGAPPGRLVAVTGPAGTGRSTIAMALAQRLADDPHRHGLVALADLALRADQAMLHDSGDVVPGVQELVEAHRNGTPTADDVRALLFAVEGRGYDVLLGLRRSRDWPVLRPRASVVALASLRRCYRVVVADVDAEVEGEAETGSIDVEERNVMARTTLFAAERVVVVGAANVHGLHRLLRVVNELSEAGVAAERMTVVLNRAPRSPRARAELVRAAAELVPSLPLAPPVLLAERAKLDRAVWSATALPDGFVRPLATEVLRTLTQHRAVGPMLDAPAPVEPGSLGLLAGGARA